MQKLRTKPQRDRRRRSFTGYRYRNRGLFQTTVSRGGLMKSPLSSKGFALISSLANYSILSYVKSLQCREHYGLHLHLVFTMT